MIVMPEEERENRAEETHKLVLMRNFPKINDRHQITDPESLKNTMWNKLKKKKAVPMHIVFKLQKTKEEDILKIAVCTEGILLIERHE